MKHAWVVVALAAVALVALACDRAVPTPSVVPSDVPASVVTTDAPTSLPHRPTVVLDPGHGGAEVGAADHGVVEKDSNLDMAMRVKQRLEMSGVQVVLTRSTDSRAAPEATNTTFSGTRLDLQARVDFANREKADLFLSLHSNGSPDPDQSGVEVWYDPNRVFGARNRALAEAIQLNVIRALATAGVSALDRGIKDDTCFRIRNGRCFPLFVLGPERTTTRAEVIARGGNPADLGLAGDMSSYTTRATTMPGALVESLFISNASDAAVLRDSTKRDVIAGAIADAVLERIVS